METIIRINGNAPAWPLLLEQPHPFYPAGDNDVLNSASYSILGVHKTSQKNNIPAWEVLIDAGHNTVPFLLNHGNRIPNAILLTHSHPDHILGVDWIVQSHRFADKSEIKYPIYCTDGVWSGLMKTYSHIEPWAQHKLLLPGKRVRIKETDRLHVTSFPVYHGDGASGASMLLIDQDDGNNSTVLFSGDMLCPLLRQTDYKALRRAGKLFIDTNNRFPDPASNHMSFTRRSPVTGKDSQHLLSWFQNKKVTALTKAHLRQNKSTDVYIHQFLKEKKQTSELPHTILDFISATTIADIYLVHYWGFYDKMIYGEALLDRRQLVEWAEREAGAAGITNCHFNTNRAGDIVYF